jgi:hypothetical protein
MGARTSIPSSRIGNGSSSWSVPLADRDPLVAEGECLPSDLRQGAAVEAGERLRGAEATAGAAEEEQPRQAVIRHGSV